MPTAVVKTREEVVFESERDVVLVTMVIQRARALIQRTVEGAFLFVVVNIDVVVVHGAAHQSERALRTIKNASRHDAGN